MGTSNLHLEAAELDLMHDGSVDVKGRPVSRSKTGGWKASLYIIGDEFSERFSYYGIASNLITYVTEMLHLNLAVSVNYTNIWSGVSLVMPIIGAFVADAYFGKYWTITVSSVVYVLGLILLTLSVSVSSLKPPSCSADEICPKASTGQLSLFYLALYLVAFGTGGVKPCLEAFGADQFDEDDAKEKKMKSSFFNWWYFGLSSGALLAFTLLLYIQENYSWGLGFGIPAIAMTIALVVFLIGTKSYRHKLPAGSPITRTIQVIIAAFRKRYLPLPEDSDKLYEVYDKESLRVGRRKLLHTKRFRFLDKAAIVASSVEHKSNWILCTVTQVEEVKLILRVFPVWLCMLPYGVVYAQMITLFTKQGSTMDRRMGPHVEIPAASLQSITAIVIMIMMPLYDRTFVPIARGITKNHRGITLLQRIGIGLFFALLTMVVAAVTERYRLRVAKDHFLLDSPKTTVPLSIFWLLPQYILCGISDIFALVGQQEFFYDQVPDTTRSFGMALYLSAVGVGSFLSTLLITIVKSITDDGPRSWFATNINRGHLDYFYWLLAVMTTLNVLVFILVSYFYDYKEVEVQRTPVMHESGES